MLIRVQCEDDEGNPKTYEVEGYYEPYVPGYTSGLPENCYPDEGGFFELKLVRDENGNDVPEKELPGSFPDDASLYRLAVAEAQSLKREAIFERAEQATEGCHYGEPEEWR